MVLIKDLNYCSFQFRNVGLPKNNESADSTISYKKLTSHNHGSSKLTSRREPRKRIIDGKAIKRSVGPRNSSRNRSSERSAKEPRLLTPYTNEKTRSAAAKESKHEAPKDNKTKVDGKPERYNELSPLMTKMVEDELKNIMINVWQALPSTVNDEAEKMVLEKLKGAAGDDLRNTIGLNVTNRLISIHNGILVKIIIYSAVTPSEIYSFSKKYNIHELKNVQSRTYAGRMHSWTDLDALVTRKDLRCGKSRVSITPIYNFLKCPPSLRTVFDGSQDYSKAKAIEKEIAMKIKKLEAKPVLTADKVLAEHAKKDAAKRDNSKSADSKDASDSKSSKETLESQKDKAPDNKSSNEKPSDVKGSSSKDNSDSKNKVSENNAKEITDTKHFKIPDAKNTKVVTTKKIESKPENKPESENKITKAAAKNVKPADKPTVNQQSAQAIAKITPKPSEIKAKMDPPTVNKQTDNVKKETKTETQPIKVAPAKTIANKQPVANNPSKVTDSTKVANTPAKVATPKVTQAPKVATTPKTDTTLKKDIETPKPDEKKPEVTTTKVETNKIPVKEVPKAVTKPVTPNAKNETVTKPSEVKKPELPTKVEPKAMAKVITKPFTPKKEVKSIPAVIKKPNTKVLSKSAKSPKSLKVEKYKRNESDYDELSDHDILKMLSSGIVLDECSGSEED